MTNPSNPINPIEVVFPIIAGVVEKWRAGIDATAIEKQVKKVLDAQGESLVLKLMGFSNKWGQWELDYCNGRSGESAAGDYFRKLHQQAIQEWMANNFTLKLSDADKKRITRDVQREYVNAVAQGLAEAINEQANEDVKALVSQFVQSNQADNYLKIRELLENTK